MLVVVVDDKGGLVDGDAFSALAVGFFFSASATATATGCGGGAVSNKLVTSGLERNSLMSSMTALNLGSLCAPKRSALSRISSMIS